MPGTSTLARVRMPRFCRLRLELHGVRQCEVFALFARIFPDLVFLNRLAAPETVFIFGPLAMMPPLRDVGDSALCQMLTEPVTTPAHERAWEAH